MPHRVLAALHCLAACTATAALVPPTPHRLSCPSWAAQQTAECVTIGGAHAAVAAAACLEALTPRGCRQGGGGKGRQAGGQGKVRPVQRGAGQQRPLGAATSHLTDPHTQRALPASQLTTRSRPRQSSSGSPAGPRGPQCTPLQAGRGGAGQAEGRWQEALLIEVADEVAEWFCGKGKQGGGQVLAPPATSLPPPAKLKLPARPLAHAPDTAVPSISLTVPAKVAAQLRSAITRATS